MPIASAPSTPAPAGVSHGWQRNHRWALAALGLVVALVYWPGLHGGYVFDDYSNIVDNMALRVSARSSWQEWLAAIFSSPASELQRPLAMLSFAINHALTGLDPYWMKLTNLGVHLLNTGLVFGLSRRVLQAVDARGVHEDTVARKNWIALWIAAAWALNPINLMAVLFVVQRMESLCHTFVFAGLWLYLVGRSRLLATGRGWLPLLGGLIGGTAFGALAKESAVLLPLYALALEWTLLGFASLRQPRDRRLIAVYGVLLMLPGVIGLAWLLPKVMAVGSFAFRNFSLGERLLSEARVLVDYLHWTLLPNLGQMSLYHDDYPVSHGVLSPPGTLAALLLLAALVVAMVGLRKRRPLMALGLAWFFAAHLLTATVIPLELMFEHRNYFASLGLMLALADAFLLAPHTQTMRRIGMATAALLLVLYAGLTTLRARDWSDPLRFALTEVTKHPQSPRATYDVARDFIILSNYQPDSPNVERAVAALGQAMHVPNATVLPEAAAIVLASRTGRPIERAWWDSLQNKLRSQPIGPQQTIPLASLVDCELQRRCSLPQQDMIKMFLAVRQQGPNAEISNIYGNYALNVLRDPTLALNLWQDAVRQAPHVVQYRVTRAKMLIAMGQFDAARADIAQVRRLGRLGQNETVAQELEQLSANARHQANPTMQPSQSP